MSNAFALNDYRVALGLSDHLFGALLARGFGAG